MTRGLKIVIPLVVLVACAQLQTSSPQLPTDWEGTLYYARHDVETGNYFAADKLLDEFVRTHPNTPEAREIGFWKAAYLIDPANERGSLAAGIAALDAYLAADSAGRYRNEAIVLRRTAAVASLKDQLAKSKDELAKVSAELDRIKKRLANPSN
jgi:hypothetical protein